MEATPSWRFAAAWAKMDGMGAGHSHAHDHAHGGGDHGGWEDWLASTRLRAVIAGLAVSLIAALVGLILLFPTGQGTQDAIAAAEQIGLSTQRIAANVITSENAPCSFSTDEFQVECRQLVLDVLEGPDAGTVLVLPEINLEIERGIPEFEEGDEIALGFIPSTNTYFYEDPARTTPLVVLAVLFAVIVIAFGRARGLLALFAMAITVAVLVGFVAPSVLDGNDPVLVALIAAALIAFSSLFLTHGFNPTTAVALAGTLSALGLTFVLSWVFFDLANFTGFASTESLVLPVLNQDLRLSSLLLGGAIIGALGALDDVTVTQVSLVSELRRSNPQMPSKKLITSGLSVGRDHIAATVNTLLLAYAGASLPVLLLFAASEQTLAQVANSEIVAVEIVRTLTGSIGLIGAVPLTTALAASILPPAKDAEASSGSDELIDLRERDALDTEPAWDDFSPDTQG